MKDILDLHTHTIASGHAYNTIQEMTKAAAERGIELLGITEHAPTMPGTCQLFYFQNLRVVPREQYGVRLMLGSEVNILDFDGKIDLPEDILQKLDLCIASIHPPCFLAKGTIEQNTNAILKAIENPYVDIIGHPDDGRFELDYKKIVEKAKEYKVLLELNNASLSPNGFRKNSKENMLKILHFCAEYKVQVIMSSDAHVYSEVGNHSYVKELIKQTSFPEELIINRSMQVANEAFMELRTRKQRKFEKK